MEIGEFVSFKLKKMINFKISYSDAMFERENGHFLHFYNISNKEIIPTIQELNRCFIVLYSSWWLYFLTAVLSVLQQVPFVEIRNFPGRLSRGV